jgi:hypothetical protein
MQTPKVLDDALGLATRCREAEGFRSYLQERQAAIVAAGAAILLVALACAAGVAMFLAGLKTWLTLPALIIGSLVLVGSAAVQLYVFFSWLEGRALAHALHKPLYSKWDIEIGPMPPVPWPFAAGLVFLPLLLLLVAAPVAAILALLLAAATPIVYAHLDRRQNLAA